MRLGVRAIVCVGLVAVLGAGGPQAAVAFERAETGVALGDEFKVATGSALVGVVFPGWSPDSHAIGAEAAGDTRWSAVLGVTGNPIRVLNRYISQAKAVGFDPRAQCFLSYRNGDRVQVSGELRKRGLGRLTCEVFSDLQDAGGGVSKTITIELRRSRNGASYDNFILLRYASPATGTSHPSPTQDWLVTLPEEWEAGVPAPPKLPNLPTIGDPIRPGDPQSVRQIDVVKGSRLLAPPGLPCAQRGGFDAVLEVTGHIDRVLDKYAAQFQAIGMTSERTTTRFRGQPATIDSGSGDTGVYGAVAIPAHDKGTNHLHLWFCPGQ